MAEFTKKQEAEARAMARKLARMSVSDFGTPRPGPAAFRGRPSLSGDGSVSPVVQLKLPRGLYGQLSQEATATKRSMSEVVRSHIVP